MSTSSLKSISVFYESFQIARKNIPTFFRLAFLPVLLGLVLEFFFMKTPVFQGMTFVTMGLFLLHEFGEMLMVLSSLRLSQDKPQGNNPFRLTTGGNLWRFTIFSIKTFLFGIGILLVFFLICALLHLFNALVFDPSHSFNAYNFKIGSSKEVLSLSFWRPNSQTFSSIKNAMDYFSRFIAIGICVYWGIKISLAYPSAAVGESPTFATSWKRTRGHMWYLFKVTLISVVLFFGINFPTTFLSERILTHDFKKLENAHPKEFSDYFYIQKLAEKHEDKAYLANPFGSDEDVEGLEKNFHKFRETVRQKLNSKEDGVEVFVVYAITTVPLISFSKGSFSVSRENQIILELYLDETSPKLKEMREAAKQSNEVVFEKFAQIASESKESLLRDKIIKYQTNRDLFKTGGKVAAIMDWQKRSIWVLVLVKTLTILGDLFYLFLEALIIGRAYAAIRQTEQETRA